LAVGCPTSFTDTFSVTLKVVDTDKKPIAGADVDLVWRVNDGEMNGAAQKPIVTGADGRARITLEVPFAKSFLGQRRAALVLSSDRRRGGIVGVSLGDNGNELTVTLTPTVRVKAKLDCKDLNFKPEWVTTTVTVDAYRVHFAESRSRSLTFEFVLPAGKYTFRSHAPDVEVAEQTVALAADYPDYDLGTVALKASAIGKLKGKPAPAWAITDARGVNADVKLTDYKGKWVYIKFWGLC
jgi:hypothetical protein